MKNNKFKYIFVLLLLMVSSVFYSQTKGIAYQAVLFKPDAKSMPGVSFPTSPLLNTKVCLRFTFLDSVDRKEYQETVIATTDNYGIVNTIIGLGSQTGGYASSFNGIIWDTNQKTLVVELDTTSNCAAFEEISNQLLATAPFALSAITANNITGVAAVINGGTGASTDVGARINLGLGNVNNTSDLNKPISTATQIELALKENISNKSTDVTLASSSNTKYPTEKAVKTYVDGKIASASVADNTITDAKLSGVVSVPHGGTGASSLTGYVVGNGTGAMTTTSSIPLADVAGALHSVNGNLPDSNGNVAVSLTAVYTGTLANRATVVTTPTSGNVYVVSGDTASNNGKQFIYTGTTWEQISTLDTAVNDAKYLALSGGTMQGNITVPAGNKIVLVDAPTNTTDVANKAYVDVLVASASPDATNLVNGKVRLSGDLAGTGSTAAMPVISNAAITTVKLANEAVSSSKIMDANVTYAKIQNVSSSDVVLGRVSTGSGIIEEIATTGTGNVVRVNSPEFLGLPTAPTAVAGTNSTQIATTAFVTNALNTSVVSKVANYTLLTNDYTVLCDATTAGFTLTLPAASGLSGKIYVIRKVDDSTNALTISPALQLTQSTLVSSINFAQTLRVQSNGTNWYIID